MTEEIFDPEEASGTDILFNCPFCGKSLAIDVKGAGMLVTCTDCRQSIQVPIPQSTDEVVDGPAEAVTPLPSPPPPPPQERGTPMTEALQASQAKIERLVESLEEVRDRRTYLETLRTQNLARFDRIGAELTVIQASIDRIVGILQDAKAEKTSD